MNVGAILGLRAFPMSRRFYQRCLLWLLPLLVVHSLVPVGFMVAAGERGLELAFCPVQSASLVEALSQPLPNHAQTDQSQVDHSHHQGMHAAHHVDVMQDSAAPGADHSQHARSNLCPFALAGTPMLAASVSTPAIVFLPIEFPRPTEVATPEGVLRFERNRIRGPPYFA
jgi:hypothetical protein